MKALFKSIAILALLALSFAPILIRAQDAPPPPPNDQSDQGGDQGTSFQTFYDQLGDQGTWVQTDDYGYVFQPNVTDPNWAPYTEGHWVYTDEGWTWVSDEPWGWATYHYGRWANIDGTGWVWVPGYRWAPAWVSWRYGGGYCGWAPLPPETFIGAEYGGPGIGIGFHFGDDVDVNFHIGAGCYNFLRVQDMGDPNYHGHFINRQDNFTVINHTRNITNFNVSKSGAAGGFRGVSAGGPSLKDVNAQARQRVQKVNLTAANQPGRGSLHGNSLAVYAPRVNPATVHQAKPATVSQTIAHPTFNRGDSITKPLAVTASVRPPAPTSAAIHAAQQAQLHAPATARIATAKTPFKTALHKPLTSMTPVTSVHQTTRAATPTTRTTNSSVEHNAANSPFTGESVKPAEKQSTGVKPATTFNSPIHPANENEGKPAMTYHPQTQGNGGANSSVNRTPPTTVRPQTPPPSRAPAGGQGGNKSGGGNSNDKSDDKNKSPGNP